MHKTISAIAVAGVSSFLMITGVQTPSAFATEGSWISNTSNQQWTNTAVWLSGTVPGLTAATGDIAWFTNNITGARTLIISNTPLGTVTLGQLYFSDDNNSFTISAASGQSLVMDAGLGNNATIAFLDGNAASHTISAAITFNSTTYLKSNGQKLTLSGGLSGSGDLVLNDSGTVTIGKSTAPQGSSAYSGDIFLNEGWLELIGNADDHMGTGIVQFNGGNGLWLYASGSEDRQ
jgi:hypothetical protein